MARSGAYGGHVERAAGAGRTASLQFTGKSVSLIGVRQPGFGSARIMIDGSPHGMVSESGVGRRAQALEHHLLLAHPGHRYAPGIVLRSGPFELDAITVAPH